MTDRAPLRVLAKILLQLPDEAIAEAVELQRRNPDMRMGDCLAFLGHAEPEQVQWLRNVQEEPTKKEVARVVEYATSAVDSWLQEMGKLLRR